MTRDQEQWQTSRCAVAGGEEVGPGELATYLESMVTYLGRRREGQLGAGALAASPHPGEVSSR